MQSEIENAKASLSAIHHDRVKASPTVALARRPTQRDIRLASGLVLFVYVTSHLVNHALGLISIDVAERGLALGVRVRQSVPGTLCQTRTPSARPRSATSIEMRPSA